MLRVYLIAEYFADLSKGVSVLFCPMIIGKAYCFVGATFMNVLTRPWLVFFLEK